MTRIVCVAVSIGVLQVLAPKLFPIPPGSGFSFERTLRAGALGGVGAIIGMALGAAIGKLVERYRQ
jgi:hypothetical protein